MSIKTFALSLLLGVTLAHPLASPVAAPIANAIVERAPAATSQSGTSTSQVSCPSSNGATFTASNGQSFIIECGSDRPGNINMIYASNFATCIDACAAYSGCVDVSYVSNNAGACYMKSSLGTANTGNSAVWGARLNSTTATSAVAAATSTTKTSTTATSTLQTSTITTSTTIATSTTASATVAGKRGLPYNTVSLVASFTNSPQVTWGYNWDQTSNSLPSRFEYVPMLWGSSASYTNNWNANAKAAIAAGSKYLLGFNEPDLSSQSNLSPSAAAAAWKTYMQPFAGQAKLVSPAVTNGGGETGLQWTKEFLGNCTGCTVDAIALHWYSDYAPDFQNHVQQANTMFGKPVWVTEFGLNSATDAQIATFLSTALPWLDAQSWVQRYAYFGDFAGYLLNSSGTGLSAAGTVYAAT